MFFAVERLLERGESFTSVGIQRIAEEAGIARTTFYGHFADKPDLLMRMTEALTTDLFDVAGAWIDNDGTRESLTPMIRRLVVEYRRNALLLGALAEVSTYEPVVQEFWHARIEVFADRLRARLEREHPAGPPADPRVTASWIAWGTERALGVHVATRAEAADDGFADAVATSIWGAMHPPV